MIWKENLDEVDTFESFYGKIQEKNNNIVIPYINIGVSMHPINKTNQHLNINKAYLVFERSAINKINGQKIDNYLYDQEQTLNKIIIGGIDIQKDKHVELEILYEDGYLQTLPDIELRKEMWIPINTPNFPANMDKNEVDTFLSGKGMPENLLYLLG